MLKEAEKLLFEDMINYYKKISEDNEEWVNLLNIKKYDEGNINNDIFSFCALIDNDDEIIRNYLNYVEWGYNTDSFGKATFYKEGNNPGNIVFETGEKCKDFNFIFEYLVAYRTFDGNYDPQIDINPEFIWYKNLVRVEDGYKDSITNEYKIKISNTEVKVLRTYLRDFLAAKNKACAICFDDRRFLNSQENIDKYTKSDRSKLFTYELYLSNEKSLTYNGFSRLLGKLIILPYVEPLHEDYLYFKPQEKQFVEYIIGIDKDTGKNIEYTCNEDKLSNFFGANPLAPNFLTPVYFNAEVLNRYTYNADQYTIQDDNIIFLNQWNLPYTRNNSDKVIVWLGDLGRIPYKEQQYWRIYNEKPYGEVNDKFIKRQLMSQWTDAIGSEKKLFELIERLNKYFKEKYGDCLFKELSEGDKQLKTAFIIPSNNSIPVYQTYLMQLCKITCERINTKLISTIVGKDKVLSEDGKQLKSLKQLQVLFEFLVSENGEGVYESLRKIQNCRNKLAGHAASIPQYNKLWDRKEDDEINFIDDAKVLLNNLNHALKGLLLDIEGE